MKWISRILHVLIIVSNERVKFSFSEIVAVSAGVIIKNPVFDNTFFSSMCVF